MLLLKQFLILILLFSLTSCAWLSRNFGSEPEPEMVPKAQYDDLAKKYEALNAKMSAPAATPAPEKNPTDELVSQLGAAKDPDVIEAKNTLMETVDVFEDKMGMGIKGTAVSPVVAGKSESMMGNADNRPPLADKLENDILELKKSMSLASQGKFDNAIRGLQPLTKSSSKQVQVRAKFGMAEILLAQREYDLALQAYEDIISNYAFSGLVINALKKAAGCAEKLNLSDKKAQYESLIKDVFESKGT